VAVDLYLVAGILIGGAALAKIAEEYKFPYPIPLIIAGILLGQAFPEQEIFNLVGIDFIAELTLATVLFYAGLTMNWQETKLSANSIVLLATLGVMLTSLIAGATIFFVTGLGLVGFLIGSILTPTDPAALFSVLEAGGIRVKRKLFSILEGEAVFNDATAVILVITVFEPLVVEALRIEWYIVLVDFFLSIGLGVVIGLGVAYIVGKALLRTGEDTNIAILTATTPILAYGLGEIFVPLGIHPGALAAVFAGIFMANSRMVGLEVLPQQSMRGVTKNVSFVFEIAVFILVGYSFNIQFILANPIILGLGLLISFLVIFVARPASVFLVTAHDSDMSWKDRFFVSWAGVKGVASAALAAISVSIINEYNADPTGIIGSTIFSIVLIVIMVSLFVQGLTTPMFAERLELVEEADAADVIIAQRDATRQALLHLVDLYTEGKVDADLYSRMKAELEEEIFMLEDQLRELISERRAKIKELDIRQDICRRKLQHLGECCECGDIPDAIYEERRQELEAEIEELATRKKHLRKSKELET